MPESFRLCEIQLVRPFCPIVRNPHFLTVLGSVWPRRLDTRRFPVTPMLFPAAPGVKVLVETQQPGVRPLGEMVLVHGLEGSGQAGYMRSMAQAGLEAGYVIDRFHLRSCGGTARYSDTLYHAGLTGDLHAFLKQRTESSPALVFLVGYSLGGNVVLKLAGELGEQAGRLLAGVCAISTPLDLMLCARAIGELKNRLYERRFLKLMRRRICEAGHASQSEVREVRSLLEFDDRFTAPSFGFRGAEEYYGTQSAKLFLDRIRVPTLVIHAKDDPMIPFEVYHQPAFNSNPNLRLVVTEYGGHLGFLARRRPRFWADEVVTEWVNAVRCGYGT